VGLVLGIGLAFLRDILDDSIKSKDDLEMAAPNVSVLGLIPTITPKLAPNELVAVTRPDSAAAEAYRSLRTSIQFMSLERPVRTLQITSPSASEGKTTTAANLAVTLASIGKRVVVVCCDLRRPRIHELFGVSNDVGFTSVLLGEVSLADALQPVKGVNGLLVLASGKPPPNPAELLAGARATELFKALADNADIVVVDSPPVLPVTDAAVIANRVDATILVASASSSVRKRFSHALQILGQVDSHVIGAVLNDAPRGAAGYGYGYGYGDEERYIADPDAKSPTNGKASPSPKPRRKQQAGKRRR
jgi:receptor protein-tyrosine kinase